MGKIEMYLNYLIKDEKVKMTNALGFLHSPNAEGKEYLIDLASRIYKGVEFKLLTDNGHIPSESSCHNYERNKHFMTLVQFNQEDLTEQAINELGKYDGDWDWRYFYAISFCREDVELYIVSFSNACSPNWNGEYNLHHFKPLKDVDFQILKEGGLIYRMCDSLHNSVSEQLISKKETFVQSDGMVEMMVKDQHGNTTTIKEFTLDSLFRHYANNYTGYRNYRRQMASEWVIVNGDARALYEDWKQSAKGLKSDFDKFYGSGIVD